MAGNSKEYKLAIKIAGEVEKSLLSSTKLTKKELAEIARQASTTSTSMSESFSKGLKDAAPAFDTLSSVGSAAFEAVATAATVAATAITAVVAASVAVGSSFEAQMDTVQAISGASMGDMERLNDLAKELGATTKYTATEAGQAMEYMAMAGWKTEDMLAGMAGVLNLASASGEELAITSDIVTDAMTAFGLGADQVEHFADVLAATATNSNTTVSMMGETFTYAASIAGAMGYSIEDVSVAIGLMANSGIKASQAGTALRKILTETTGGATVACAALGEYTIETQNADGSMRELGDTIKDLRYAFSQMTEAEKAANAESIAGKTGMSGLMAIVNASEADFNKLTNAIYNSTGAAQKMADIRIDNLAGDATIMRSALEGLGIEIYEEINEPLRAGVQWFTELIGVASTELKESGILTSISEKVPTTIRRVKELTTAIVDFSKPFFKVGGWLIDNPGVITGAIASIGTAIVTYKVASGIMSIASALGALGPVGWTILGIGAVVGIITGIGTAVKKSAAEAKKANLAAHFGNISLSLKDLEEVASHIVSNDSLGQLREAINSLGELDGIQREIDDSVRAINKMNWKVSIGMQLSVDDMDRYKSEIAQYVENCQNYITEKQYAVNLAVGVLTGDSLEGSNIVNTINQFYSGKQAELAELGKKLNDTITEAFQDGLLDMDEVAEITQLQQQMAKIQSAIAGSNFDAQLNLLGVKYGGAELDAESFKNLQAEIQKQMDVAIADYDEAYTLSVANAKIMLDDGAISQEEYNKQIETLKQGYLDQISDLQIRAAEFQTQAITDAYKEDIEKFNEHMKSVIEEYTAESYQSQWNETPVLMFDAMAQQIWNSGVDKTTKQAIAELLKGMEPSIEDMEELKQKYVEAGMEIPKALEDALNSTEILGAMTVFQKAVGQEGDMPSLYDAMYRAIAEDPNQQVLADKLRELGFEIPEAVSNAVTENTEAVNQASQQLYSSTHSFLTSHFAAGFDVTTNVRVHMNPIYDSAGSLNAPYSQSYIDQYNAAIPHAEGGIFNTPHYGVFAEEGAEAFIPIDGSQRAIDLWEKTGQLLGMNDNAQISETVIPSDGNKNAIGLWEKLSRLVGINNNTQISETIINNEGNQDAIGLWENLGMLANGNAQEGDTFSSLSENIVNNDNAMNQTTNESKSEIVFSPTLQFYGEAPDKAELDDALAMSQERFEEMMERYMRNNTRLSFGWEG